jgi:hypothetical protein
MADSVVAPEPAAGRWLRRLSRVGSVVRAEDWLLAGMVGLAGPALLAGQGSGGPFDPGRPIDGVIRVAGFLGALACLATRNAPAPGATPARSPAIDGAVIGPLTGGLLLVGGSAAASLGQDPEIVFGPTFVAVLVFVLLGDHRPALSVGVRRALVTPFVLAAGGLFWGVVRAIVGSTDIAGQLGSSFASDANGTSLVIGVLVAAAAVYYAMLVYAPRQVAEREGGPIEWLVRFGLFCAGVAFGLGWLAALGG